MTFSQTTGGHLRLPRIPRYAVSTSGGPATGSGRFCDRLICRNRPTRTTQYAVQRAGGRLRKTFISRLLRGLRRFVCFSCATFFEEGKVIVTDETWLTSDLKGTSNWLHFQHVFSVYPSMNPVVLLAEELNGCPTGRSRVMLCADSCSGLWEETISSADNSASIIPVVSQETIFLRPFASIPVALTKLSPVEAAKLSLLEIEVSLGGGLGRGHFKRMEGDFRLDEDLAGTFGTPVAAEPLSPDWEQRVSLALQSTMADGHHSDICQNLTTFEMGRGGRGGNYIQVQQFDASIRNGRSHPNSSWNDGERAALVIPVSGQVKDDFSRANANRPTRAGLMYNREGGPRSVVHWGDGVEEKVFPRLFMNNAGGFRGKVGSKSWHMCVERRLFSVNPLFRLDSLYLCFLFDWVEKTRMHDLPAACFLPTAVDTNDAVGYAKLVAENSAMFEASTRSGLKKARRAVGSKMVAAGPPDLFATETMNERDFPERDACKIVLYPNAAPVYDDVTTATLFKKRSIEIVGHLISATDIGVLSWAAMRLEIQGGKSFRLHAHSLLKSVGGVENVLKVVTAARQDVTGDVGSEHFRVGQHKCQRDKMCRWLSLRLTCN